MRSNSAIARIRLALSGLRSWWCRPRARSVSAGLHRHHVVVQRRPAVACGAGQAVCLDVEKEPCLECALGTGSVTPPNSRPSCSIHPATSMVTAPISVIGPRGIIRARGGRPRIVHMGGFRGAAAEERLRADRAEILRVGCRIEKVSDTTNGPMGCAGWHWRRWACRSGSPRLPAICTIL